MDKKVRIYNVDVDCLTMGETVSKIEKSIKDGIQVVHNSINANKVVLMYHDSELKASVTSADILNADGQAIVWASRLFRSPLPERVPGIDLMDEVMKMASKNRFSTYLFGAKEEIVKSVSQIYTTEFSNSSIAGYRNGYFGKEEEEGIANEINKSGAKILFVGIPSPHKENFIKKYRYKLKNVKLLMGVGGSFDVISGKIPRAPSWMQDNGLEWLFRLVMEPRKMWRRYLLGNIEFIKITWKEYKKIKSR